MISTQDAMHLANYQESEHGEKFDSWTAMSSGQQIGSHMHPPDPNNMRPVVHHYESP